MLYVVALTILACGVVLAGIVLRYDMYEKEPWWLLLLVLLTGLACGWCIGTVEDRLIYSIGGQAWTTAGQAWVAGISEEAAKLSIVLAVAYFFRRQFNDPIDGLIYGSFAGLGFAIAESIFYAGMESRWEPDFSIVAQEAVRLMLHLLLGGLDGFGVGMARFRMRRWRTVMAVWISTSILLHFCWDNYCGMVRDDALAPNIQRLIAVGLLVSAMALFGVSVWLGVGWSRDMHGGGIKRKRLWGWPFTLINR